MPRVQLPAVTPKRRAWNKGRLVGQKRPLLPKQVWAIRARLELAGNLRDLALFNVAIDSKLRGCDLVALKVADIGRNNRIRERVSVIQSKTNKPVGVVRRTLKSHKGSNKFIFTLHRFHATQPEQQHVFVCKSVWFLDAFRY